MGRVTKAVRMTLEEIAAERARIDAKRKAEALASEATAVYNLDLIRKMERRIAGGEILTDALCVQLGAAARELTASQESNVVLARLVVRMGRDLHIYWYGEGRCPGANYTIAGQREYDAAMHEAEGPDVRREDCVP